jgi:peptidoglycan/xylan/chitin deacetylase (PgdA/CDA1 family)
MTDRPLATSPRQPPLVHASIGLHVFMAGIVTMQPSWWPMALATLVADHAVITAAGLWPTSTWLGPNLRRLSAAAIARSEIAITIDDGPDPEVTPRVLDALDALNARATFFCIGSQVLAHPGIAREIVRRGHAIENHSFHHRHNFSLLGPNGYEREILAAQRAISETVGGTPRFFRAPAGLRNVFLQPVLARHRLELTSWTRRGFDTVKRDVNAVSARLLAGLAPGDILLLHDGHAARSAEGEPVILEALTRLASAANQRSLRMVTLAEAYA